jgi:hypothetical protein
MLLGCKVTPHPLSSSSLALLVSQGKMNSKRSLYPSRKDSIHIVSTADTVMTSWESLYPAMPQVNPLWNFKFHEPINLPLFV